MMPLSTRECELADAQARAARAGSRAAALHPTNYATPTPRREFAAALARAPANVAGAAPPSRMAVGTVMSELIKHGGLYTLSDPEMTQRRMTGLLMGMGTLDAAAGMAEELAASAAMAEQVPTFFFYHLVRNPYKLHSQLVSYISHPARHLGSPTVAPPPLGAGAAPSPCAPGSEESFGPHDPRGKTYSQCNTPSPNVPAAATFIGQFIDHDLTLNALNLLSPQTDPAIRDMASPLIDLDNVYGPRLDDTAQNTRLIPIADDKFCLRPIPNSDCFDVCRMKDPMSDACKALIGDKRNDENQLILQVHIAAMRLHNHFAGKIAGSGAQHFAAAKKATLLHWQAMVATYYLPLVARAEAIKAVKDRLFAHLRQDPNAKPLCHRPGLTACGGTTLGMPHEFAIGFRFGHSQLRSEYRLRQNGAPIRLFDPLQVSAKTDLTGDKHLTADHCINWSYFTVPAQAPSNRIDTEVNEVVFSLPESTIPDDVKLVTNLPLRNLIRSNDLGLCAGEDLQHCYAECYGDALAPALTANQIEPPHGRQGPFMLEPNPAADPTKAAFRTPLWYYLLREAELHNQNTGQLGMVGSLLVAEVILSGIRYARLSTPPSDPPSICAGDDRQDPICSIFEDPDWANRFAAWDPVGTHGVGDEALVTFLDLVTLGHDSTAPACEPDNCPAAP